MAKCKLLPCTFQHETVWPVPGFDVETLVGKSKDVFKDLPVGRAATPAPSHVGD